MPPQEEAFGPSPPHCTNFSMKKKALKEVVNEQLQRTCISQK